MKSSIFGVILAVILTYVAVIYTTSNSMIYMNLLSFIIVLGGTVATSIVTFGVVDLVSIFNVVAKVFFKSREKPEDVIAQLVNVANKLASNRNAINSLVTDRSLHPFIVDGLKLIQNDFNMNQIKSILQSSLMERQRSHMHYVEILKTLAKYPPAFGMIGTVLGLVAVLQNLGSTTSIENIGPDMAIALITTLYGLFFANYIFIPLGDNMLHRMDYMMRVRTIIIKGILLISEKEDPIFIQEMLSAHLLPAQRNDFLQKGIV